MWTLPFQYSFGNPLKQQRQQKWIKTKWSVFGSYTISLKTNTQDNTHLHFIHNLSLEEIRHCCVKTLDSVSKQNSSGPPQNDQPELPIDFRSEAFRLPKVYEKFRLVLKGREKPLMRMEPPGLFLSLWIFSHALLLSSQDPEPIS